MSQNAPWYRSNQVLGLLLILPILGQGFIYLALSPAAQGLTRPALFAMTVCLIVCMGMNARSAAKLAVASPSDPRE